MEHHREEGIVFILNFTPPYLKSIGFVRSMIDERLWLGIGKRTGGVLGSRIWAADFAVHSS